MNKIVIGLIAVLLLEVFVLVRLVQGAMNEPSPSTVEAASEISPGAITAAPIPPNSGRYRRTLDEEYGIVCYEGPGGALSCVNCHRKPPSSTRPSPLGRVCYYDLMDTAPPGVKIPIEWDQTLSRYHYLGGCAVPSVEELISYLVYDENTIQLAEPENRELFVAWLRREGEGKLPNLSRVSYPFCRSLHSDPRFKALLVDRLQGSVISPSKWRQIYETIGDQLADPNTPLGMKGGMTQLLLAQQGLLRPKKLEVKQQHEHRGAVVIDLGGSKMLGIPDAEVIEGEYAALEEGTGIEAPVDFMGRGEMDEIPARPLPDRGEPE